MTIDVWLNRVEELSADMTLEEIDYQVAQVGLNRQNRADRTVRGLMRWFVEWGSGHIDIKRTNSNVISSIMSRVRYSESGRDEVMSACGVSRTITTRGSYA